MQLPANWRERAIKLPDSHPQAIEKKRWFQETGRRVWIEDDCPLQTGLAVVEENPEGELTVFLVNTTGALPILPRSWS